MWQHVMCGTVHQLSPQSNNGFSKRSWVLPKLLGKYRDMLVVKFKNLARNMTEAQKQAALKTCNKNN